LRLCLLVALFSCLSWQPSLAQQPGAKLSDKFSYHPADPLNAAAFDHFYDMDYDSAIQEFTQIQKRHPDDADAVNHLLTAVLFHELYRIGALSAGEYASDSFVDTQHHGADPRTCDEIKSLAEKAQAIEGAAAGGRGGGRGAVAAGPDTFASVNGSLATLMQSLQESDTAPSTPLATSATQKRAAMSALLGRWSTLQTADLAALNAQLAKANLPVLKIDKEAQPADMDDDDEDDDIG